MNLITEQRLARRAHILETARELITERGYHATTVRDLAERCRVSVPTLYNQFGGKDALLGAAIEDHFNRVVASARLPRAEPGLPRLLAIIDACAQHILERADYHRRLLDAFASLDATQDIQLRIAWRLVDIFETELRVLQKERRLAAWADTALLAGQLNAAIISSAMVWSSGHWPGNHLLAGMRYATGLVLGSVLRGAAGKRIETWTMDAQAELTRARDTSAAADEHTSTRAGQRRP